MTATLCVNTRVLYRSHPEYGFGTVKYVEEDAFGDVRFQVSFDHLDQLQHVKSDELDALPDPIVEAANGNWGAVEVFRRKLATGLVIGENNITGGFTKAAVQPLPHQAFLLDKILSGNRFGHILADDVGLGKTIEAGLVITSLLKQSPPQRVLVVCPTGLALQWQDELDEHFSLFFAIMGDNFDGKLAASWRTQPLVIAPIDRLKREEYRELLSTVANFDLVICDEAHRLKAGPHSFTKKLEKTANYRLFEFLNESRLIKYVENNDQTPRSPRLLLLSGTPHQGDDERFLHLLHLVRPDLFQPRQRPYDEQLTTENLSEAMTRTPKSRAVDWEGHPLFKGHITVTLDVKWSVEETEVSRLLTDYILKSLENARQSDRTNQLIVQLVMHTFHKIAASSWPALENTLKKRLENLGGKARTLADIEDGDDMDEMEELTTMEIPGKAFFENERPLLEVLLARIRALPADTKWERCHQLLSQIENQEPGVKLLIFTQYRATQTHLACRLRELFSGAMVEIINGDTQPEDRRQSRVRFENASRFLVSTEAGGEGINLQKACHVMLNYDLPWNPMRLQQRIGRLDRYGQKRVVQVFNLRVPDSWDNRISLRILERLAVIQRTMNLAGPGLAEDYQEMLLGQIAEQIDADRLFAQFVHEGHVSDKQVDEWITNAIQAAERWKKLFTTDLGLPGDGAKLKPALSVEGLKSAFQFACEAHGIRLMETRNSQNQFVRDVFNFRLPDAFRDPILRPSRTFHVVFDREVFSNVRSEDLGTVRGQAIRPSLAGFGEPLTDWLFETSMQARVGESAFALRAGHKWPHDSGALLVYALRWLGKSRRLSTVDSLAVCFVKTEGEVLEIDPPEAMMLAVQSSPGTCTNMMITEEAQVAARRLAQESLKSRAANRNPFARSAAGLSLLFVASVEV